MLLDRDGDELEVHYRHTASSRSAASRDHSRPTVRGVDLAHGDDLRATLPEHPRQHACSSAASSLGGTSERVAGYEQPAFAWR